MSETLIEPMVNAGQLKAARALLGLRQQDIAAATGVSEITIRRMEAGEVGSVATRTYFAVVLELERRGIEFVGGGARLRDQD